MFSIFAVSTLFGVIYMIRTNCETRQKCCRNAARVNLVKEDRNLDYGTYYDADGERRQDVMEVAFDIISINHLEYEYDISGTR